MVREVNGSRGTPGVPKVGSKRGVSEEVLDTVTKVRKVAQTLEQPLTRTFRRTTDPTVAKVAQTHGLVTKRGIKSK